MPLFHCVMVNLDSHVDMSGKKEPWLKMHDLWEYLLGVFLIVTGTGPSLLCTVPSPVGWAWVV